MVKIINYYFTMQGAPFLKAPGNYRALQAVLFSIKDGSLKRFVTGTVKLSAKERKWTSLEIRTHLTFLDRSPKERKTAATQASSHPKFNNVV